MHRRDIFPLVLVGVPALVSATSARAQQPRRAIRIGVLLPVPRNDHFLVALREGLRDAGWTGEGDVEFEVRRAAGTVEEFRRFGKELAALPLDVLVTASTAAATALAQATTTIPIVFVGTFDPIAAGLVASLERPGGNVTGIAGFQADIAAQWVSHLKEIAPQVARMVIFSNPAAVSAAGLAGWKAVAARSVEISEVRVESVADIGRAVASVAKDPQAGMIVVPHTFPFTNRDAVVAAMAEHRVPAIYGIAEMVRSGGLISYGQDLGAQWRMSAQYIDRIVRGAKPAELPVQYATKYALAINARAAKALSLVVPPDMLKRADEVID